MLLILALLGFIYFGSDGLCVVHQFHVVHVKDCHWDQVLAALDVCQNGRAQVLIVLEGAPLYAADGFAHFVE